MNNNFEYCGTDGKKKCDEGKICNKVTKRCVYPGGKSGRKELNRRRLQSNVNVPDKKNNRKVTHKSNKALSTVTKKHVLDTKKLIKKKGGYKLKVDKNDKKKPLILSSSLQLPQVNIKKTKSSPLKKKVIQDAKNNKSKYLGVIRKMIHGLNFSPHFQVMRYKELRPREIKKNTLMLKRYVGWFMSEKIDGWQAIWDGKETLYSKGFALTFNLPDEWLKLLPPIPLMGEIKIGDMPATQVRSLTAAKRSDLWKDAKFHVFDIGSKYHSMAPFHERYALLSELVSLICKNVPQCPVVLLEQTPARSVGDIMKRYKSVKEKKGEGIILTDPDSLYSESKSKSSHRVKLKVRNDMEGLVVGFNINSDDTLKSLVVEIDEINPKTQKKVRFKVGIGFTDEQRKKYKTLFKINVTKIKFSYAGFTKNKVPKEAHMVEIFTDK